MAIVNMSVDTKSRQVAVTIDGTIVPAVECHLHKFLRSDGTFDISLSYTVSVDTDGGLSERRTFFLPDDDDTIMAALNENGLLSRVDPDSEVFASQLQDFLKKKTKD